MSHETIGVGQAAACRIAEIRRALERTLNRQAGACPTYFLPTGHLQDISLDNSAIATYDEIRRFGLPASRTGGHG
jgi:hypothetical protein